MRRVWTHLGLWLQALWSRLRVHGAERRLHDRGVALAVERIVDQANPALRGLNGYRRRLTPVAERLRAYSEELIAQIPGPTSVDPGSWSTDPLVNALFGDVQRIRQVVTGPAVRAWLKANPVESGDELHALLVAMPDERTQLGMELIGDQVQKDVRQTTLSFHDQEVHAIGADMAETRRTLANQVVDLIVSIAIADIAAQEERIAALEEVLRMLRIKLKVVNPRAGGVDLVLAGSSQHLQERDRLQQRIDETARDLADASRGLANISEHLDRLVQALSHPEQEIGLERMRLWVDRMNIVRDSQAADAHEIQLVRARRRDHPGRVALFIRFPRAMLISPQERLADVERHLGL